MNFFNRNAGAIQALAALLTVFLALAALFGVKWQIDAADKIQRAQSARDIYREYLSLAISKPEFAKPDYCKITGSIQEISYEHFVEYLLYTAEQTISVDEAWSDIFLQNLKEHEHYVCLLTDVSGYSDAVSRLIANFQSTRCKTLPSCAN
jgi:hypothetical protein